MDITFNNVEELYKRIRPALRTKVKELLKNNIMYVKEEDIWNFLVENRWKEAKNLELSDIVDDILNIENDKLALYVQTKMRRQRREANLENNIL